MKRSSRLAMLACVVALCGVATAQSQAQAQWIADQNGCLHLNPQPKADERLEWSGACKDGKGQGLGELRWVVGGAPSQVLKVTLLNGKAEGRGSSSSPKDGSRYEGDFRDGRMAGYGTLHLSGGMRYDGPFKDGVPHGQGTLRASNGTRYEGTFAEGFRTGKGRMVFFNGSWYEGDFVAGTPEGRGLLQRTDGGRYEGLFSKGWPAGLGVSTLPDGTRYEGEFAQGKPTGVGQYRNAGGDTLAPPIDPSLQLQLSFLQGPVRPQPAQYLDASKYCSKMVPPVAPPNLAWSGQASFVIQAIPKNGRLGEITVLRRDVDGIVDENVLASMLQAIKDAVAAYECQGEGPLQVQQEFIFEIE